MRSNAGENATIRPRRFGRTSSGAVSIYMAAVMAAMIFLTGTLIDFGRIAAFRQQAELSIKAGARGVLSAYDPVLYERYGLFAVGGGAPETLLSEVLEGHRDPEDAEALRLLDTAWRDGEVVESRPLGSHAVFKRQVLEEMKYKAPIDLTLDLASRFKGLPTLMKEARKTSDLLEEMRLAYERREAALDRALASQIEAGGSHVGSFQRNRSAAARADGGRQIRRRRSGCCGCGAYVRGLFGEAGGRRCTGRSLAAIRGGEIAPGG
ncbi:TadE/TadG family type IV pilus assembly protein [Cohnella rhizosphaerae]|uniref:Uncharacterized protein n=1 Tax=Cohnella rhizosphaerae TaxID=1457232 RepID=A0A9X4KUD6_9BACL|nr:hypothetical protein [Cohnella rhizosphaerae]MDG0808342.1 hypothetical protein [Cohnella rhizosphaerae]